MKTFVAAAASLLLAVQVGAASFQKTFGGPHLERGVFVSPTRDGGYVAVGFSVRSPNRGEDVFLVRVDATGRLLWTRSYGGPGDDDGWAVHETADGGFIVAGFTESFGVGDFDCYLIKTDPRGETEWSETYGGERTDRCWSVVMASDGGYLLVGETASRGAGAEDCLLLKTDPKGRELWSQTYGGAKADRCFALAVVADGGVLVVGLTESKGAGGRDAYVLKTDAHGGLQWSRTFGGPAMDVGHGVTATFDGAFVVTGYTASFDAIERDPYLIKLDAQGKTLWTRVLALDGINHTLTGAQARDGGFCLAGFTRPRSRVAALLVKTDDEGRLAWSREFYPTASGESLAYTVRATTDGGCVFTGHTTVGAGKQPDLLIVKTDVQGR